MEFKTLVIRMFNDLRETSTRRKLNNAIANIKKNLYEDTMTKNFLNLAMEIDI